MIRRLVRRESEKMAPDIVETRVPFVSFTSRLYWTKRSNQGCYAPNATVATVPAAPQAARDAAHTMNGTAH
jgi:hypothetical protein